MQYYTPIMHYGCGLILSWKCPRHVPGMWTCPEIMRTELNDQPCFGHFCSVTCPWNGLVSSHRWIKNNVTHSFYCVSRRILLCRIWIWFLIYFYYFPIFKMHIKNKSCPGLKKNGDKDILTKMSQDILRPWPGHVICPVLCPLIFRPGQAISN